MKNTCKTKSSIRNSFQIQRPLILLKTYLRYPSSRLGFQFRTHDSQVISMLTREYGETTDYSYTRLSKTVRTSVKVLFFYITEVKGGTATALRT